MKISTIIILAVTLPTLAWLIYCFKIAVKEIYGFWLDRQAIDKLSEYSESEREGFKQLLSKSDWRE